MDILSPTWKFKMACKSKVSDATIEELFLNFVVVDEEEIEEIIECLREYRPEVLDKMTLMIPSGE